MINIAILPVGQKVILFFIGLEVFLSILLFLASYISQLWLHFNFKKQKKVIKQIEACILSSTEQNLPENFDLIFLSLRKLSLTKQRKQDFVRNKLLKKLRPFINSSSWIKRYFLVEAYEYVIEPEDRSNVIKLINDPHIIISLNAMRLNNELKDQEIYKVILQRLSTLDQTTRSLYIPQFHANSELRKALKEVLENSPNSLLKKICYDIIYYLHIEKDFYNLALRDVELTDRNCQLAAIRILGFANPEKAKSHLFALLKSENWLIRNSAIQSIKDLKVPGTIEELYQCLNDENYWIRVNATKKFLTLGKEGEEILNQYRNSKESQYKEIATYFLDINRIKDKE